ncbi:MAG: sodium:calcium symporter [Verrucomicrobiales bacterium]|nr:sodium:calcium symporter [Verrucomicrobiales bacterium]
MPPKNFNVAPEIIFIKLGRVPHTIIHTIEAKGHYAPWLFLALFVVASLLMIWRLEVMSGRGFEGTVLGTLVMPYCSGLGNLFFAFILGRNGGNGADVMTNSLVNNVTNMTLVLGLPAIFWGIRVLPGKGKHGKNGKAKAPPKKNAATKTHELNRLSLLLTLTAVLFFTGAVWALGRNGKIDFNEGLVLVGLFLFWQCFHVFDVLKHNVRQGQSLGWTLPLDLALLGVGAYGIYVSTDWLVGWISNIPTGFISAKHLGWLSGWLMVLPNALLALYYGWRGQPETVYASQVGDSHVSIPLCIGIYTMYHTMDVTPFFNTGMCILLGATLVHFLCVAIFGQLPRFVGLLLVAAYGVFLYMGLLR